MRKAKQKAKIRADGRRSVRRAPGTTEAGKMQSTKDLRGTTNRQKTIRPISFTEMIKFLRSELRGLALDQVLEVEGAQEFLLALFEVVWESKRMKMAGTPFQPYAHGLNQSISINPWTQRLPYLATVTEADEMNGQTAPSTFRFPASSYTTEAILYDKLSMDSQATFAKQVSKNGL
ncbi:hypothetical protein GN244_ATG17614 [Phytophthora infestans]|uniref:Uncharacterized protein n=1 Tax=Phytophthora infestans TaxID=4787 RepID=A0A833S8V3_PHYIN|nr:hypothetical protein GN244_ATG17614 [Phytophthora infestans]